MPHLTLAGKDLDPYYHVCAFVKGPAEWAELMGEFFKEGITGGEKCLHIVNAAHRHEHLSELQKLGVDTQTCSDNGQLEVLAWEDAYLKDGEFRPERMLGTLEDVCVQAKQSGFPGVRIMGDMGWALTDASGRERLIEYEALVNDALRRNEQPAICVYDINRLSAAMMMDILRTHPLTLVGGVVQENPFYTPAEELLPEIRRALGNA